jgi:poly-gamma-glutamate capsule biosynthesis protein CapA/YwtB (metallophosphatase superfamily)
MNNDRRKEINKAIGLLQEALSILEVARDEEGDTFNNMPENLQSSERGQKTEEAYGQLESACCVIEEAISECESAAE